DSGYIRSVVNKKVIDRLRIPMKSSPDRLYSANGSPMATLGLVELCLNISGLTVCQSFEVCNDLDFDILLGVNLLRANNVLLHFRRRIASFDDIMQTPIQNVVDKDSIARVYK